MPANVELPKKEELPKKKQTADIHADRIINKITFFGDSAIPEGDELYTQVYNAAKHLAQAGYTIVDGGGPGLMKAATDGAEEVNGDTVAIYWEPKLATYFEGKNLANIADESSAQSNYVTRTFGLIEEGDAYVICKGGTGTVSEFGLVWCLAKLYYGLHKPVILYGDFWMELIEAFKKNMYIDEKELAVLYYAKTPEELLNTITDHERKLDRSKLKKFEGEEAAFMLSPSQKMIIDTYNQHAQSYHAHLSNKLVAKEQLDEFIKMVNPPAQVLDIGCGPGFDAAYLSEKYAVSGVEISKRMAEIAKFENPNVDIIHADIVKYDIGKNKFKGIWARDSIHHIARENLNKVFKKIADALVDDGIFYIIVREGKGEFVDQEHKAYGKLERFYHMFDAEELTRRAEKVGLKLVKLDHVQRSHKWISAVFKK